MQSIRSTSALRGVFASRLAVSSINNFSQMRFNSDKSNPSRALEEKDPKAKLHPNTPEGIRERSIKADPNLNQAPLQTPYPPFPDGKNPKTGEYGGPTGPEPTRFGDWERKGRVTDF